MATGESLIPGRPNPQRSMPAIVDPMSGGPGTKEPKPWPTRLWKASLLIALYPVRSESAFCEELAYNLPFRRFLDMGLSERGFDAFTKNW